jgi:hypothetical protein
MQHSCVPAVHADEPHAKVVLDGGAEVGAPVGEPVGDPVGEPVGDPVAIEGGVVIGPPEGSVAPGAAGSVGLVVCDVPPIALPSVEPPHAAALLAMPATTPRSEAKTRSELIGLAECEVFIGGTSG